MITDSHAYPAKTRTSIVDGCIATLDHKNRFHSFYGAPSVIKPDGTMLYHNKGNLITRIIPNQYTDGSSEINHFNDWQEIDELEAKYGE